MEITPAVLAVGREQLVTVDVQALARNSSVEILKSEPLEAVKCDERSNPQSTEKRPNHEEKQGDGP